MVWSKNSIDDELDDISASKTQDLVVGNRINVHPAHSEFFLVDVMGAGHPPLGGQGAKDIGRKHGRKHPPSHR